jgi:hypothetical protein
VTRDEDYELWLAMNEDFEEAKKEPEAPHTAPALESESLAVEVVEVIEEAENEDLGFVSNLIKEPQTNTITITPVDPLAAGSIITDDGQFILTGSIELPVSPTTGSIAIITVPDGEEADAALSEDFAENYVSSIAPIRASGVMNSRARESVLPIKKRRGESQTVLLAVTSILMVTVGALVLAAWLLGVL